MTPKSILALTLAAIPLAAQTPAPPAATPSAPSPDRGTINFVVNVHDWVLVDESAATVSRLVSLFKKHGLRCEFYLTAPVVEAYQSKHPEVIAELKESGMTISYHVRPPHPLWRGFSRPLDGLEGAILEESLRDYETFHLDMATGRLDAAKPGGYRFVEQVFGTKPVAVGASDAPPAVMAAAARVYASLGAKVGVFYHESGTPIDRPFEFRNGLLARPSDFSITRAEGESEGQAPFWWNMVGTPREADFNPVQWLRQRLAAWKAPRPPYVTALIHENDFYRQNGPGWNSIYLDGRGPDSRPRQAPFNLATQPADSTRPPEVREAIFAKYEELVVEAAKTLRVATSSDLAAEAGPPPASLTSPRQPTPPAQPGPEVGLGPQEGNRQPGNRPGNPAGQIQIQAMENGPWNHDVLVHRVPAQGQAEKLATFEHAGVPTLARLADGRLAAAFQWFPRNDDRRFDRVAVAFSQDEGRTWTAPESIRVEGMEEGLMRPFDPTLVPLPDGRVRLYFTSNRQPDFRRSVPAIYSAISQDALHFTFEPGLRFAIDGRIVIDCAAALQDGLFHLIVPDNGTAENLPRAGQAGPPPPAGKGYHAISRDGLKFERVEDVTIDHNGRWLGNLQSEGGRLFFFGSGGGMGRSGGIWLGSSADGKSWKVESASLGVPGADPGAIRLRDGSWLVAATGPMRQDVGRTRPDPQAGPQPASGQFSNDPSIHRNGAEVLSPVISVRIPSAGAGDEGLAATVTFPPQPRYAEGAPVIVFVAGGVQAGEARARPEYVSHGFVEIHFAFPGGGVGEERSGGTYDFRGPACVRALVDVIRFATGAATDKQGRKITDLRPGLVVLTRNCGIVGSSHGGNACGLAMAKFGAEFPALAWYASMESPYGEGAANVELGGRDSGLNPAYDPATGRLDLGKLAWSADLTPGLFRKSMPADTRTMKGAFFFDLNGDGRFDPENDFPANCFVGDAGKGARTWYSPRLLAEAEQRKLVADPRPAHLPTVAEAQEFWSWRDAAGHIAEAVKACPQVAVLVYANERDHVQADPAHTHILEQVEGFRQAGVRFVRLNPDRCYLENLTAGGPPAARGLTFPDNPAGRAWDRGSIRQGVEPAALPLGLSMQAAVAELADRTQAGKWDPNLDAVLFPSAPKPVGPPGARMRQP